VIPTKRLTKKQIEEGLKAMPMETLLLGVSHSKQKRLTHKQIEFAKQLAMGESKASAYRKSHKSKGKPKTQSNEGQKLAKNPTIAMQVDAFKVALEAQKYQTPAHLRALAIHKITEKVLDKDCPPAQQLKALELLGKITEVALFTERREVVQVSNPSEMREKLMASIKLAIENSQAIDVETRNADELMAELVGDSSDADDEVSYERHDDVVDDEEQVSLDGGEGIASEKSETPLGYDPQNLAFGQRPELHSIPLTQSPEESIDKGKPCLTCSPEQVTQGKP
jgi:hypothetical protein